MNLNELKILAKQYLDALPEATPNEAIAGFKCFCVEYFEGDFYGADLLQAEILVKILAQKHIEHEMKYGFSDELLGE
jgi:hypothetical protein